jgi:predicted NBD/HSP70 family sugar kinase
MSGSPVNPAMTAEPVPVLEIGGSHVTAALVDLPAAAVIPGTLRRDPLNASGPASAILESITTCARGLPTPRGAAWGVAIPGPFDYRQGVALFTGVGKFDSLYGMNLKAALATRLPGPPGPLRFLNDAHAFLRGEWLFGAAAGHDRCAGITLGTGIGSAFLLHGRPQHDGPAVPPQGRVDLLRIHGQPLEEVVSSRAITSAYRRRGTATTTGVAEIATRATHGDPIAADVLHTAFQRLGAALAPWLASFQATAVVAGGAMTGSWNLIKPALQAGLNRHGQVPASLTISLAAHPDHAPLLGAAAHAAMHNAIP